MHIRLCLHLVCCCLVFFLLVCVSYWLGLALFWINVLARKYAVLARGDVAFAVIAA